MDEFSGIDCIRLIFLSAVAVAVFCGVMLALPEAEQRLVIRTAVGGATAVLTAMWTVWPTFTQELNMQNIVIDVICLGVMAGAIKWALDPWSSANQVHSQRSHDREVTT